MDRKKAVILVKMLSAALLVVAVAGIFGYFLQSSDKETASDEVSTDTELSVIPEEGKENIVEAESAKDSDKNKPDEEFTQSDVDKLMVKYEAYEEKRNTVRKQAEGYRSLPDGLTEEQIHEISQSRILQCYEENVLLAAEVKTILIGGLGVTIPVIKSDNSATENYTEYLKEQLGISGLDSRADVGDYLANEIADEIIGQIGSEAVQKAVRYGYDGALEAYRADGTLASALDGAVTSVVEGVVSDLQEYPYELAKNALDDFTGGLFSIAEGVATSNSPEEFLRNLADEKSGGLVGSIASAVTYEGSPTALFQSMSKSARASAVELNGFLEKDTVNSADIANMMYQYSQYGEVLNDLKGYNWKESYDAMAEVYSKFVSNEVMISLLGSVADIDSGGQAAEQAGLISEGLEQNVEDEKIILQGSTTEQYLVLEEKIAGLDAEIKAYSEELEELRQSKLAVLREYSEQLDDIEEGYKDLIEFNVKNFEPLYDVGGSQIIEKNKKINNAIGELSKYTPWGITLGLFSSMAMEDGNNDYVAMVSANNAFGTGLQTITVDTKAEIEKFKAQLTFYEDLTQGVHYMDLFYIEDQLRALNENQYLLEYVLAGEAINLEPYADEVRKKLYIMGVEIGLIKDYYRTILTPCDSTTRSLNKLNEQYNEIMTIVDPDGTGRIADMVTMEELAEYLIPLIDAGIDAEEKYSSVGVTSPLVEQKYQHAPNGTKVYWYIKSGLMKCEGDGVRIYFANGQPVYVDRIYFYQGRPLNVEDGVDTDTLYETAKKMVAVNLSRSDLETNENVLFTELNRIRNYIE